MSTPEDDADRRDAALKRMLATPKRPSAARKAHAKKPISISKRTLDDQKNSERAEPRGGNRRI
ncbi:hypothetical protein [Neoroseomonas terrae]|uniref:hypothetical protein n=1 Tax=Neoroseomonas terrae TaxID=424799 RepID=UPI001BAD3600|nr:hypothetical protein [Neoroseomonas terrae]